MNRILVTGGAGFLGSHLCDRLVENGHEVVAVDNCITGRTERLILASSEDRFEFREADVTEPIEITDSLDCVLHLASLASPVFYRQHPLEILKTGSFGTHNTFRLAREKDAKYLFASTSEVYGDPEVNPQSESYRGNVDPYGPRSCYDEGKRYGESSVRIARSTTLTFVWPEYSTRTDHGCAVTTAVRFQRSSVRRSTVPT